MATEEFAYATAANFDVSLWNYYLFVLHGFPKALLNPIMGNFLSTPMIPILALSFCCQKSSLEKYLKARLLNMESALKGKKILVVDDEPELREAIVFDLKRRGCIVFEANDGNEAFEIVKAHGVDIVLSDVRMPNSTGVDLLKRLREIHISIPFVLLATGFADLTEAEAFRFGAQALIEKPIDRKRMLSLLESSASILDSNAAA